MTDIHQQSAAAKGFAGLTYLASTLSAEPIVKPAPIPPRTDPIRVRPEDEPFVPDAQKPGFWTGSRKTWAVVIAGICLIAFFNSNASKQSYSGANYAPPSTPATRPSNPPPRPAPAPTQTSEPMKIPTGGLNQTLSQGEIKYCLAGKIRIEAMREILDNTSDNHITNFNFHVREFNSRCSNYQYRQSDMIRAQTEIEDMRAALRAHAVEQVRGWH
ncbi:hypothetical protein ACFPOB_11405 [Bosea eneae]|uniref:DUF4168 domain-containing protein n=2 Tax=Bosea TaxID=85413 RepID=A0A9E7ZKQ9_9HYPH